MKKNNKEIEKFRVVNGILGTDEAYGNNGAFLVKLKDKILTVIASDKESWDHVSVSAKFRTPTWDEMSFIKDLFFEESETVVQFHPKKTEYVNIMPHCLHLWRNQTQEYVLPPKEFV